MDVVRSIEENCYLMVEESVAVTKAINAGEPYAKPSHRGPEYDLGYAQGRKDACRVILLDLDPEYAGPTSEDDR